MLKLLTEMKAGAKSGEQAGAKFSALLLHVAASRLFQSRKKYLGVSSVGLLSDAR